MNADCKTGYISAGNRAKSLENRRCDERQGCKLSPAETRRAQIRYLLATEEPSGHETYDGRGCELPRA
jgi:hypothetical protein